MNPPILSPDEAQALGYRSMTRSYNSGETEQAWLRSAIATFRGATICIVEFGDGVQIYRLKTELRDDQPIVSATQSKQPRRYGSGA